MDLAPECISFSSSSSIDGGGTLDLGFGAYIGGKTRVWFLREPRRILEFGSSL